LSSCNTSNNIIGVALEIRIQVSSYERLVADGKHKKIALTACMHKMMTILNAMIRRDNKA